MGENLRECVTCASAARFGLPGHVAADCATCGGTGRYFQSAKHPALPPDRLQINLRRSLSAPAALALARAYQPEQPAWADDLRARVLELHPGLARAEGAVEGADLFCEAGAFHLCLRAGAVELWRDGALVYSTAGGAAWQPAPSGTLPLPGGHVSSGPCAGGARPPGQPS